MDAIQTLDSLEQQRDLVEHFIGLSEEHLLLWEDEDQAGLEALFERRALLMSELTMLAETVVSWIRKLQRSPFAAGATTDQMQQLNQEIVDIATHIMDIDERLRQNFQGRSPRRTQYPLD